MIQISILARRGRRRKDVLPISEIKPKRNCWRKAISIRPSTEAFRPFSFALPGFWGDASSVSAFGRHSEAVSIRRLRLGFRIEVSRLPSVGLPLAYEERGSQYGAEILQSPCAKTNWDVNLVRCLAIGMTNSTRMICVAA
jgi:hypothetical protein